MTLSGLAGELRRLIALTVTFDGWLGGCRVNSKIFSIASEITCLMTNLVLHTLPFASAASTLVGRTFSIPELQFSTKAPPAILPLLIGFVTIASVCALAAQVGATGGVLRGATFGTIAAALAYVVPTLYLTPMLSRYCNGCTKWGQLGLGVSMLVALLVVLMCFGWLISH